MNSLSEREAEFLPDNRNCNCSTLEIFSRYFTRLIFLSGIMTGVAVGQHFSATHYPCFHVILQSLPVLSHPTQIYGRSTQANISWSTVTLLSLSPITFHQGRTLLAQKNTIPYYSQ